MLSTTLRRKHFNANVNAVLRRCKSKTSNIAELQLAFRDPTSPFHIPPGGKGPSSADHEHELWPKEPNSGILSARDEAHAKLLAEGYDQSSFWEQPIVWGDHDAFQHVNNVRYLRFFETGRIEWIRSLALELGGPAKADAMIKAQGVSFILKSIEIKFKRPVTYPDTLLIAHKAHVGSPPNPSSKSQFNILAKAYSFAQHAVVAESDCVVVWYDYDKLRKCEPNEREWKVLMRRMQENQD